jgi:hypothetical protein
MSDLVERVARALIKRQETHGIMDTPYSEMARIALRAILETHAIVSREMSEAMKIASRTHHGQAYLTDKQWQAMLAAAPDPLDDS